MNISERQHTKQSLVNYFSDYILNKLPKDSSSKLEVAHCENLSIIKGVTTSKEILNISDIRDEFSKEVKTELIDFSKTIDLIEYGKKFEPEEVKSFNFYNNQNTSEPICEIGKIIEEEKLVTVSSFPHGYSWDSGRGLYYTAKNIVYNLQFKYPWNSLKIKVGKKDNENNLEIFVNCEETQDETLRSSILDCFNFNFEEMEKQFYSSEWLKSSLSKEELEFVKKVNTELIIL